MSLNETHLWKFGRRDAELCSLTYLPLGQWCRWSFQWWSLDTDARDFGYRKADMRRPWVPGRVIKWILISGEIHGTECLFYLAGFGFRHKGCIVILTESFLRNG